MKLQRFTSLTDTATGIIQAFGSEERQGTGVFHGTRRFPSARIGEATAECATGRGEQRWWTDAQVWIPVRRSMLNMEDLARNQAGNEEGGMA